MKSKIELYDVGRTTHRAVPGMYEFIVEHANKYVNPMLARKLSELAEKRELPGHSISQESFTAMCDIWTRSYCQGDFEIAPEKIIFADTISRFRKLKEKGKRIGILTSGSKEFTEILYKIPITEGNLSELIDEYFFGEKIGDKDDPRTFSRLWERTDGSIESIFDDKLSVCNAAFKGLSEVKASPVKIYLVDRKRVYTNSILDELKRKNIQKISNFDEVTS